MQPMNLAQEQKRSNYEYQSNVEITRQRNLAIHGLACVLVHEELKQVTNLGRSCTFGEIMEHDSLMRLETNRCLAKMIAAFGRQSVDTLMKIAVSFGETEEVIKTEAIKLKKQILISFLGGQDEYLKIFADRNREV